jgi:perosamine synthetase
MQTLALLGGDPVVSDGFAGTAIVDQHERDLINEALERKEFSRFMGSPTADIEKILTMPSEEAPDYQSQYFTFLGGRMVRQFERDAARYFGVRYAVSVNSGTSGLSAALAACGAGPGDEVITTCLSFSATAMSILAFNSIPVFVDVSPTTYGIDAEKIEAAITEKTKAILVVHLLGIPVDMARVMDIAEKHGLRVIEDCAQSIGSRQQGRLLGTIGDAGVLSFQETKNIMTGEGGMLLTNDETIARKSRLIRNHGESIPDDSWSEADLANIVGMNYRMTELTAAMGIAQMAKLDENNRVRQENTALLHRLLSPLKGLSVFAFEKEWVPHILPMLYGEADTGVPRGTIIRALRAEGIPVGTGYLRLMNENPVFSRKIAFGEGGCPMELSPLPGTGLL